MSITIERREEDERLYARSYSVSQNYWDPPRVTIWYLTVELMDGKQLRYRDNSEARVIEYLSTLLQDRCNEISMDDAREALRIINEYYKPQPFRSRGILLKREETYGMAKPQQQQSIEPSNPPYSQVTITASANGWTVYGKIQYRSDEQTTAAHTYTFDDFDKMSTWLKANIPNLDA